MNVLNLFSGMEVGRLACERAGVPIDKYYSSEVDKYAIQVSKANWPDIIHLGDVTKVYGCTLPDIHLLLGGSPCQGFSFAGKQLNFNDPRSALLFEYVRILKELREYNPNVCFLLENVVMKKEYQDIISELLGVQPIKVNSALVSAQNRKRLYWTNIPFLGQPEDKRIVLKDILETDGTGFVINKSERSEKAMCIDANYHKGADNHGQRIMIIANVNPSRRGQNGQVYDIENKSGSLVRGKGDAMKIGCLQVGSMYASNGAAGRVYSENGKSPSLVTGSTGGNKMPKVEILQDLYLSDKEVQRGIYQAQGKVWKSGNKMGNMDFPNNLDKKAKTLCTVNTKGGRETNHVLENGLMYRKLTVTECERLQTVPDGYVKNHLKGQRPVSNTQAYKMLGNSWTSDVIKHMLLPLGDYSCLF